MQQSQITTSGITLVALVVTIVILIILSTISIFAVLGENGIIRKAQEAKGRYEQAKVNEEVGLSILEEVVDGYMPKPENTPTTEAGTQVRKPNDWSNNVIAISDGNGTTIPLPNGFYYVGGNYNDGLVISDKQGDTMTASGTSMGNQFVWIPVPNQEALTRTEFDTTTGQPTTGLREYYTEPYANGYETEASEHEEMQTQVLKYGGFYIGRYEAGVNGTTLRTTYTTAKTVVSKKRVSPYTHVPWGATMNDASEVSGKSGAVYLAKNMYNTSTSVTSTLIYGCQWDAMCRYIGDANRTTPTTSLQLTGSVETDVSKNIYDLAGNCTEWTMEADNNTGSRVQRGGYCYYSWPVSTRYDGHSPSSTSNGGAFRCALYIK